MFLIFALKLESTILENTDQKELKMYYLSKFLDLLSNCPMFLGLSVNMHMKGGCCCSDRKNILLNVNICCVIINKTSILSEIWFPHQYSADNKESL